MILQSICHAFAKKKCKNCILIHTFSLPFVSVKGEAARNKARNTPLKATHHASFPELVPDVRMEIALDSGKTGGLDFLEEVKKPFGTRCFLCLSVCPIYHLQFHHPRQCCGFVTAASAAFSETGPRKSQCIVPRHMEVEKCVLKHMTLHLTCGCVRCRICRSIHGTRH